MKPEFFKKDFIKLKNPDFLGKKINNKTNKLASI